MTKLVSIASVVLVLTIGLTSPEQDCPVKCTCYKHQENINRQVVECTEFKETDLIGFNNLSVDTTDLILRDGSWSIIDFGRFPSHLTKLITISINNFTTSYLSRYSDSIHEQTFEEVQNVSIRFTKINLIRKGMFDYFPKITHIILDHNQIDEISKKSFSGLKNIEFINLSHNSIETIEEDTFTSIEMDLSNNKLKENYICLLTKKLLSVEECPPFPNDIKFALFEFPVALCFITVIVALCAKRQLMDISHLTKRLHLAVNLVHLAVNLVHLAVNLAHHSTILAKLQDYQKAKNKKQKTKMLPRMIHKQLRHNVFEGEIREDKQKVAVKQSTQKMLQLMTYYPHKKLGYNVFEGEIRKDKRKVAVKRSKLNPYIKEIEELDILLKLTKNGLSSNHVIQYIMTETDSKYQYIALSPVCEGTLHDAILKKNEIASKYMATGRGSCLEQTAEGLKFLHDHGVEHRDIKPKNILIKYEGDTARFIIADFDLGHITGKESLHKTQYGTKGWVAPELWDDNKAGRSPAVDVFSMGCVFYYALTKGCHPFGEIDNLQKCQRNICNGKELPQLSQLTIEGSKEFKPALAKGLINLMIKHDFILRPTSTQIKEHPMFWSDKEISEFYHDIGNMAAHNTKFQSILRADSNEIYSEDWTSQLDEPVISEIIKKNKKIDKSNICTLLKTIRNKTEHFDDDLSKELKKSIYYGCCKQGVARYFNEKFPNLLLYTLQKKEELDRAS